MQPLTQILLDWLQRTNAWRGLSLSVHALCAQCPGFQATLTNTISDWPGRRRQSRVASAVAGLTLSLKPLARVVAHDAFLRTLCDVIDDPDVEVEIVVQAKSAQGDFSSTIVSVIESFVREKVEDALILLITTTGFTDSRVLRRNGSRRTALFPRCWTRRWRLGCRAIMSACSSKGSAPEYASSLKSCDGPPNNAPIG